MNGIPVLPATGLLGVALRTGATGERRTGRDDVPAGAR
jgi:hypothetical protein